MNLKKVRQSTYSYDEWLVHSLKNKKEAAVFLETALEEFQQDGDLKALLIALRHVVEAQGGIGQLAKKTHLNRESLYKMLSTKGDPKFKTVGSLLKGIGFKFTIQPIPQKKVS